MRQRLWPASLGAASRNGKYQGRISSGRGPCESPGLCLQGDRQGIGGRWDAQFPVAVIIDDVVNDNLAGIPLAQMGSVAPAAPMQ